MNDVNLKYSKVQDDDATVTTEVQPHDPMGGMVRSLKKIQLCVDPFLEKMAAGKKIKVSDVRQAIHYISTICFVTVGPINKSEIKDVTN